MPSNYFRFKNWFLRGVNFATKTGRQEEAQRKASWEMV